MALPAVSLAMGLSRADSAAEGTNKSNPMFLSPQVVYCQSNVDEQCTINVTCVAQAQPVYHLRLNTDDVTVPPKKIHFYDDKENFCPPPKNVSGAPTKRRLVSLPPPRSVLPLLILSSQPPCVLLITQEVCHPCCSCQVDLIVC
jgi:hypothetical protein